MQDNRYATDQGTMEAGKVFADNSISSGLTADEELEPVGLIACWGKLPIVVADAIRRTGRKVYCLGLHEHADPKLAEYCHEFRFMGLGRFGAAMRYFKRRGIRQVTMAGKIHKVNLFKPWLLVRHFPDLRTIRMFLPHFFTGRRDNKDDSLLGTVCDGFLREGIEMVPATDFAPELLVKEGQLTRRIPTEAQWKDIRFGWELAKTLGRLDCGQSVAVKKQAVLALEAIEGTDQCIRRAGTLCRSGDFVVVKTAKPNQDMRFDVPTIGIGTLETMVEAGARVLAVEADQTIFLDQDVLIDYANQHKLIIVSCSESVLLENSQPDQIPA